MSSELDAAMLKAWKTIEDKVLGNPIELRRRLDRRAKMFERVPRPLCLAIKASDRRITEMNAHLSVRHAMDKGHETEHDVLLLADTIKDLCRPVELYWGQEFRKLAGKLGAGKRVPRELERRGILRARRIPGLGGQSGPAVPLVDSPVPAMAGPDAREWEQYGCPKLLDPGAWGYTAPDKLLLPYWQQLSLRLPDWFEQRVGRKPVYRVRCGRPHLHWVWVCPECRREVNTIYFPLGAPDFVRMHGIELPKGDWYDVPEQRLCFACHHCHHLYRLARTAKTIAMSWSRLVAHLSGGLLFGHEVKRPASFCVLRKSQRLRPGRPSPRRDELEAYLAQTELSLKEIARRMGLTYKSVAGGVTPICKKRRVKGGRAALKRWWKTNAPPQHSTLSAA